MEDDGYLCNAFFSNNKIKFKACPAVFPESPPCLAYGSGAVTVLRGEVLLCSRVISISKWSGHIPEAVIHKAS